MSTSEIHIGHPSPPEMPRAEVDDEESMKRLKCFWDENGYCCIRKFLNEEEVGLYRGIVSDLLSGARDVGSHLYDLGSHRGERKDGSHIPQIMWPSDLVPEHCSFSSIMHQRVLRVAKFLIGDDAEIDFDMSINKLPLSNTPTPAHMDAAYWPDMSDTRAASFWISLDHATLDNGCMWYGPGTHKEAVRVHRKAGPQPNAALECDASESEMVPVEMEPGDVGIHAGKTLHYSRGNSTALPRRAYIINCRPKRAIAEERALGFDHGRAGHKTHAVRASEAKHGAGEASGGGGAEG